MVNQRYSYSPYKHYIWIKVDTDDICTQSSQTLPLIKINKNRGGGEGEERGTEDTEHSEKIQITQRRLYYPRIQCGCNEISYHYRRQYSPSVGGGRETSSGEQQ